MEPASPLKFFVAVLFVPAAYIAAVAARRWLPPGSKFRSFIERHGVRNLGWYMLLAVWFVGGLILSVKYS